MAKSVILILTDQLRGDCIGANGNEVVLTPFLDQLAVDGNNFENAHATNPSCIPARANILTGLDSYNNGFFGYCDGVKWNYKNTMVDLFNDNGFNTVNIGKTHFYPQNNAMNFKVNKLYDPQSLDTGFVSDYHKWLKEQAPFYFDNAIDYNNNSWIVFPWQHPSYCHPTEWTMREAITELEENKKNDLFLQISFHRPHPPFDPPSEYLDYYRDVTIRQPYTGDWSKEYEKFQVTIDGQYGKIPHRYLDLAHRAYLASITHIDHQIGKLIHYLKTNGLYDDTTILFTSDHGEMLGDHNMFRKATPFRGSIHIPFILKTNQNTVLDVNDKNKLVTHVDVMPTLLSAANIAFEHLDGEIVNTSKERELLIGEHPFDRGWHFILDYNYKYIWDSVSGEEWLFDVINDKFESNNVIKKVQHEVIINYREKLLSSFRKRKLDCFIDGENLKIGAKLKAYDGRFNIYE